MHTILWVVLALGVAAVWSYVVVRRTRRILPRFDLPAGERLPMTAMQRVAWQALAPTLLLTVAAAAMVAVHGVMAIWDSNHIRDAITVLLVAALVGYTYFIVRVRIWLTRDDGTLDERDRTILASAPAGQAPAMMVAVAAWMVALTKKFGDTHLVPSPYLYAIFWTVLLVSIIASLLGILIGYRRS